MADRLRSAVGDSAGANAGGQSLDDARGDPGAGGERNAPPAPGGKRLFVSAPSDTEVATRVKAAMVLQEMSFLELWEAMHCIEPAIAAAAAIRISDAELDLLEENVDRTRHAAAHSKDLVALDSQFHAIIASASRSRTLQLCREPIGQLFYPAFLRLVLRSQRRRAHGFRPRADSGRPAERTTSARRGCG